MRAPHSTHCHRTRSPSPGPGLDPFLPTHVPEQTGSTARAPRPSWVTGVHSEGSARWKGEKTQPSPRDPQEVQQQLPPAGLRGGPGGSWALAAALLASRRPSAPQTQPPALRRSKEPLQGAAWRSQRLERLLSRKGKPHPTTRTARLWPGEARCHVLTVSHVLREPAGRDQAEQ